MIQTQKIIKNQDEIINCILTITKINKIYIFGSYARGEQTQESDIDFYIVLENNLESFDELLNISYKIRKKLIENNLYTRMDILLNDKNDFENKKNTNGNIEYTVNQEGVIIYGE